MKINQRIKNLVGSSTLAITARAKELQAQGKGLIEATLAAVHMRLRPILMTSFAFILGVTPLAFSTGAGSASQHAIGTGVAGGMISATVLAIFLVPVFFVAVRSLFKPKAPKRDRLTVKEETSNGIMVKEVRTRHE